mgnify:CR=1 FL=1
MQVEARQKKPHGRQFRGMAGGGASTTVGDGAVRLMRELRRPRAMEEGGWACAAWGGFR